MFIIQVSYDAELFDLIEVNSEHGLEMILLVTHGKILHIEFSGLPGDRALSVGGVILKRWSLSEHFSVTLEETLHSHC